MWKSTGAPFALGASESSFFSWWSGSVLAICYCIFHALLLFTLPLPMNVLNLCAVFLLLLLFRCLFCCCCCCWSDVYETNVFVINGFLAYLFGLMKQPLARTVEYTISFNINLQKCWWMEFKNIHQSPSPNRTNKRSTKWVRWDFHTFAQFVVKTFHYESFLSRCELAAFILFYTKTIFFFFLFQRHK